MPSDKTVRERVQTSLKEMLGSGPESRAYVAALTAVEKAGRPDQVVAALRRFLTTDPDLIRPRRGSCTWRCARRTSAPSRR